MSFPPFAGVVRKLVLCHLLVFQELLDEILPGILLAGVGGGPGQHHPAT